MTISIDRLRSLLQNMNLSKISRDSGVQYDALVRFTNGTMKEPKYEFITKLAAHVEDITTVREE